MTFEEMKKIVVDTLNCDADKVTMEASPVSYTHLTLPTTVPV